MPIYISRGKFTTDAVKGMLVKPENREEAVANLFKSCGGKLIPRSPRMRFLMLVQSIAMAAMR